MSYIDIQDGVSAGAPIIKGRRLTVYNVVTKVNDEGSLNLALEDYELTLAEVREAVDYCERLICQSDSRLKKFCSGCVLRTLQEGWSFSGPDFSNIQYDSGVGQIAISKDGMQIFLGTIDELKNHDFGKAGWIIAADLKARYPVLI